MLKKTKDAEVLLLDRRRVTFEIEHQGASTPSRKSLKEEIAKELKVDQNFVAIRHIFTKFGVNKSKVIAHVYKNENLLKSLEPRKGKKVEAKPTAA